MTPSVLAASRKLAHSSFSVGLAMKQVAPFAPFALFALFAPHRAASQDLDAQLKWTEAKVVHYRIAGDFSGKMRVLGGEHSIRNAEVSDHIEFEFDWDNQEMTLLGTPVLRNTPTKLGAIDPSPIDGCPPVRIEKPAEFASITKVTAMSVLLKIEFTQQPAEGALPWGSDTGGGKCGDVWERSAASSGTQTVDLQLPPGMMLAMPPEQTGYTRSKDGKSLIPRPENGWSWVITPSIVK
jgi:hypothetical protein